MVREDKTAWKSSYFVKLLKLFDEFPKCFVVGVDNVGSRQMQKIRVSLRGHAELLMGKNTMIRKAIRGHLQKNPALEKLMPYIVGNVGFVFTKEDLTDVKDKILENKVAAPAKAGAVAPIDVVLPAQNTGLGPEKTSFFQALSIPTKISKGTIEILNPVNLIKSGDRVGASEATLLNMLNISPFTYGLVLQMVYDNGSVFEPHVLDITSENLRAKFCESLRLLASLALAINYPCRVSAPHSIANGLKNLLAIASETDITFKEAEKLKEYLKDPSKFAVAAAPAAEATGAAEKKDSTKAKEEAKKKEESESDEDMGLGLFD